MVEKNSWLSVAYIALFVGPFSSKRAEERHTAKVVSAHVKPPQFASAATASAAVTAVVCVQ